MGTPLLWVQLTWTWLTSWGKFLPQDCCTSFHLAACWSCQVLPLLLSSWLGPAQHLLKVHCALSLMELKLFLSHRSPSASAGALWLSCLQNGLRKDAGLLLYPVRQLVRAPDIPHAIQHCTAGALGYCWVLTSSRVRLFMWTVSSNIQVWAAVVNYTWWL